MRTLKEGFFGNIGIGKTVMIENWLKEMGINHYTINNDLTIDVKGDVNLARKNITELPEYIQFGTVKGFFDIYSNPITTLRGCPKEVGKWFNCGFCDNLTSLEGAPKKVGRSFQCSYCKNLTTLEGAPQEVGGGFYCHNCNNLTSLECSPQEVGGNFECNWCKKLKSLEGAPEKVSGNFECNWCENLKSLEGAPKEVKVNFNCKSCGRQFTKFEVETYSNVKKHIYV